MIEQDRRIASEVISDPVRVRDLLAQRVRRVLNGGSPPRRAVVQWSVPVESLDLFHWLHAQSSGPKLFWSGRDDNEQIAAVGVADAYDHTQDVDALGKRLASVLARSDGAVRYYGGIRFDSDPPVVEPAWSAFGAYHFVLPRFELRQHGLDTHLVCNLVIPEDRDQLDAIISQIERLRFPEYPLQDGLPLPTARKDRPQRDQWRTIVSVGLKAFEETALEKVVLARATAFDFADEWLDPIVLVKQLTAATPSCFHFYMQFQDDVAFVGASPEQLFRCDGRALWSEAVAGTRPRGDSVQDDQRLREELLHSEKDQREHAYVRRSIRETLGPLCEPLRIDDDVSEMTLARGRHLVSSIEGRLRDGISGFDVLQALHPTPAVGGYPKAEARQAIRERESFDRGWYAGPIGWIGKEAAEFAVGIRSGLVQPQRLTLYSGAGIVRGSVPDAEWDEIEHKISDFMNVLGLDLQRTKY